MSALVGGGPQVNAFEQVYGLGHHTSLPGGSCTVMTKLNETEDVRGTLYSEVPYPGEGQVGGSLFGELQCIIGNGHMGPCCEQTDRHDW